MSASASLGFSPNPSMSRKRDSEAREEATESKIQEQI